MAKLEQGRELNLYECCSIYTMHLAVWILGRPGYPEASHLAYLMLKKSSEGSYITIFDNAPVRIPKDSRRYKLTFPDNLKIDSSECEMVAGFYDLLGNYVGESPHIVTYDCRFVVTYADITYYVGKIKLYGALFKYIQDKGWIHSFTVCYSWQG